MVGVVAAICALAWLPAGAWSGRTSTAAAHSEGMSPRVSGVTAGPSAGSGEVAVSWDALPPEADVAFYRVYVRHAEGYYQLALVTDESAGEGASGRVGLVDHDDVWPHPNHTGSFPRCYVVTAVSAGLEGLLSDEACGSPIGY